MTTSSDKPNASANTGGLLPFPVAHVAQQISQKELALQGLDPALVDAEIVDSATTIPVDTLSNDFSANQPVTLSPKMKKRLQELGITELFAGNFRPFPSWNSVLTVFSSNSTTPVFTTNFPVRTRVIHAL